MTLIGRIEDELKAAMRARDRERAGALRLTLASLRAAEKELQRPLHQEPRLLMIPQFVMRKRIGTQKPPVVAIGLSNAIQQHKIGLQTILATTKAN